MIKTPPKIRKTGHILLSIVIGKSPKVNKEKTVPVTTSAKLRKRSLMSFFIKYIGKKDIPGIIIKKGHIFIIYS